MKFEYQMTMGLNDKNSHLQEIETGAAKTLLSKILLQRYGLYAFTLIDCSGVYTHNDGTTVFENSLRIEIITEKPIKIYAIARALRRVFNQESIMVKTGNAEITF